MNPNHIAYCGLYCPQCSFQTAAESGDLRHLLAMPERYDKLKGLSAEECACKGCKLDDFCGPCPMKDCASEKGYISCADCEGFPCAHTTAFESDGVPHHAQAIRSLREIQEEGYEKWTARRAARTHCGCGKRQSWYHTCAACAEK